MKSFIKFTDCKTPNDILAFCQQNDAILENSNFRFNPITGKPSEDGVTYKELLGSPIPGDGNLEGLRFQLPLTYAFDPEDNSFDFGPVDWAVNSTGGVILKIGAKKSYDGPFPRMVYDYQNMEHYEAFYGKVLVFGFVYVYGQPLLICGKIDPSSWGKYTADFFFVPYTAKDFPNYGDNPLANKLNALLGRLGSYYQYQPVKSIPEIMGLGSKRTDIEACCGLFPVSQGIPVMFREPVQIESIVPLLVDDAKSGYGTASTIYKDGFSVARVSYTVNTKEPMPLIGVIPSGIRVQFNNKD